MLGAVAEILRARGSDGWLVGGSVRDRLLGDISTDLDIVVADDAEEIAKKLAATLRVPWFSMSERYPTYRVLNVEGHVDLTSVRGTDILADLGERDFTINAMAVPVAVLAAGEPSGASMGNDLGDRIAGLVDSGLLLDPFNGVAHLRQKRLAAVSERIFIDDALRLMRAARFGHVLGFEPDAELLSMIEEHAVRLASTAVERVVNEICISLAAGRTAAAVRLWERLGLLSVLLPECAHERIDPGALDHLDDLLEDPEGWFPKDGAYLRERMTEPADGVATKGVALRVAGIMLGLSVIEVQRIARRLKLSGSLTSLLSASARCLGRAVGDTVEDGPVPDFGMMLPGGASRSREAVLFLWEAAPWEPEVVMLGRAVRAASTNGEKTGAEAAWGLLSLAIERACGGLRAPPVNGDVLMRELGLEGGPALGQALREVRLAWEAGEATTAPELVEMARQVILG